MLTASQARARARNDIVVYNEVKAIELAILHAADTGYLECTVGCTGMTDSVASPLYYQAWKGTCPNSQLQDQMSQVILNFTKLGYSIQRKTNNEQCDQDTFVWFVSW